MTLEFFPAPRPNKSGVLVVPGGGYGHVSDHKEGLLPALWLNERGYDAWVLTYTVASEKTPSPIYPAPQREAVDAVQKIRAQERVTKLGIWGWSAGGHLSAITVTNINVDLDFAILAYPVISMAPGTTHDGSRWNLIGDDASPELESEMSAHNKVTNKTPPVFLFHTANDPDVPVANSLLFAAKLAAYKRPFSILVLPDGPHGVGLSLDDPKLTWTGELGRWLDTFVASL